jgi:Putative zinc-finger
MKCWRVDLSRNFSRYLIGELAAREVKRVEDHLLDCGACRSRLARMRDGHRLASHLPRATPQRDVWLAIESALDAEQSQSAKVASPGRAGWRGTIVRPSSAVATLVIALGILAVLLALNRSPSSEGDGQNLIAGAFELRDFHRVSIADYEHNTEPHVVAEGYVSEVMIDNEDGDLTFKLVDDVRQSGPFIVCEIINPKHLTLPSIGSRVRVYGVSRYDNQENHNWYEVHPVLNIEVVRR